MNQPTTMRALLLKEGGFAERPSPPVLEAMDPYVAEGRIEVPRPGEGQVLIRVSLAAINPSDVMFIKGLYGQPRVQGRPAGFEGVGMVVASGGGELADALVGRRVAFATGASGWGSWAEFAVADARGAIPLVDGVADSDGAALIVNPLTALAMFDLVRDAGAPSFVLTAGASQLGKLLIALARDAGLRSIAIVRRDDQAEHLAGLGAAAVLNSEAPDFRTRLRAVVSAEKPAIFLDAVTGPVAATVFHAMGEGARWVIYGRLDFAETSIREPGQLIFQRKRIEGFWLTDWIRRASPELRAARYREVQERFADGRWSTDVTAIVPLGEAVDRVAGELARPNGKVFIRPAG